MRDSMRHRGPDDAGSYLAPGIALGSRRLAILDLSRRGHMPMSTPDGRYEIVYNGEVYNYVELRRILEGRGYRFHSNTDTEVVLNLYADQGPGMLDQLNGMFAFAIWDNRERTLFLARDRLGIKPLYYAEKDGVLYFASEEQALFAAGIPAEFDPKCWEELLCFRYVAGENTPYRGVRRLLPGHYLLWSDGAARVQRWWSLSERARKRSEELPREPGDWFRETFDDAVRLRRISDVPVGVLLSGGVDSSSVAAALSLQAGAGVASFTVRFAETGYDEGELARQVAERWGLEFHTLSISRGDLLAQLERAAWLHQAPLAHGHELHILAISEYAKPRVTVLLSGEGADETLGGYVRYQPLRYPWLLGASGRAISRLIAATRARGRVAKLGRFLGTGSIDAFVLFNACEVLPEDLAVLGMSSSLRYPYREQVLAEAKSLYPREPMRQAMFSDHHTHLCSLLDRNDRMTMGASIECRVPFLDYRLVERAAALPSRFHLSGRLGKQLLRRSLGDRLPEAVRSGRKWGFAVPWSRYLREVPEFRDLLCSLPEMSPVSDGPFVPEKVCAVVEAFLAGEERHASLVGQLAMITVWYHACVSRQRSAISRQPPAVSRQ
jgi:asparagine synthase (glutamine-hydrolysing)